MSDHEHEDQRRLEFLHRHKSEMSLEWLPHTKGDQIERTARGGWIIIDRSRLGDGTCYDWVYACDAEVIGPVPFSEEARLFIDRLRIKAVTGVSAAMLGDPSKDVSATAAHAALPATTALGIPNQNIARPASIILSMSVEERREQRRYETARDVLAAIVGAAWDEDKVLKGQVDAFEAAERAVHYADVLLEELDIPAE